MAAIHDPRPSPPRLSEPQPTSAQPAEPVPLLPTLVSAVYKGGAWKTSIAVAIAELLAWLGLRVLLVSVDRQRDAMKRLGVDPNGRATSLPYGTGLITVTSCEGEDLALLIYDEGANAFGLLEHDVVVLDMPPEDQGGWLPGTFMVVPVANQDCYENAAVMLGNTPHNTKVTLVRVNVDGNDPTRRTLKEKSEWRTQVKALELDLDRALGSLPDPVPRSQEIEKAHKNKKSIWLLPDDPNTDAFRQAIELLCRAFWKKDLWGAFPTMPTFTRPKKTVLPGWSRRRW